MVSLHTFVTVHRVDKYFERKWVELFYIADRELKWFESVTTTQQAFAEQLFGQKDAIFNNQDISK